jgi:hypothetical protein
MPKGIFRGPTVARCAHESTTRDRSTDGSTHDQDCRYKVVDADQVPDRLQARERVGEIRDDSDAGNRPQCRPRDVVTEAHPRWTEHPIERRQEWEEESSQKDGPEGVSRGVVFECPQSPVAQQKTRLERILQEIASQAECERGPEEGRRPAVEESSQRAEENAPCSDHNNLREVQEHTKDARRDEDQHPPGSLGFYPRAQRVEPNRRAEAEGVVQPE